MPKFYDDLKNMGETNLSNFSEPQAVTFAPTSTHYNRGVIERYFVVSNLTNQTIEIDEVQYNHVKNPTMGINSNLWVPKRLKWKIKGPAYDLKVNGMIFKKGIYDVNLSRVEKASLTTPPFRNHFNDLLHSAIIQYPDMNNLTTDGSEYITPNGQPYQGAYHIHNGNGPMVGAVHSTEPHDRLFPVGYGFEEEFLNSNTTVTFQDPWDAECIKWLSYQEANDQLGAFGMLDSLVISGLVPATYNYMQTYETVRARCKAKHPTCEFVYPDDWNDEFMGDDGVYNADFGGTPGNDDIPSGEAGGAPQTAGTSTRSSTSPAGGSSGGSSGGGGGGGGGY